MINLVKKNDIVKLKDEKKYIKLTLAISCLVFFLLCLFSILKSGNSTLLGDFYNPNNDDVKFIRSARILVETGNYVYHRPPTATVFMMPGLSFTLAFFMLIFGEFGGLTAFRIVQALVQTGSLFLVFLIARKIFNSRVAIIAVIMNALYFADIWVANLILTETFFKFFVLCLIYFSIYAIEKNKAKYYVLGGIAWGLATLFRPTIATYPIVILILWLLNKYTLKDIIKNTIITASVFCVILSPWWIRNYSVFHKFIPMTLATGNPMLQGTYINYDQSTKSHDGLDYSQFKYDGTELGNNEVEMAMSKYRLKNLVPKQPLQFLYWYTIGKTINQINGPFYWIPIIGIPLAIVDVYHYLILIFSLIGAVIYYKSKERNKMGTVLVVTSIYFIVVYLPFYAFSRYFYPAIPYLIILSALVVEKIISFTQEKIFVRS